MRFSATNGQVSKHSPHRAGEGQLQGLEARSPGTSASHDKQGDSRGLRLKVSFTQLYSLVYSRFLINII